METNTTSTAAPTFHKFTVGDGATRRLYTDCEAYTVIAVSASGKTITLRRDRATLLNPAGSDAPDALKFSPGGFVGHTSGVQRWHYDADPAGAVIRARVNRKGEWRCGSMRVSPGRHEHYDFNF